MDLRDITTSFFETTKNSNCLLKLEEMLLSSDESVILSSIDTTEELFTQIFERGLLKSSKNPTENQKKYDDWLQSCYQDFVSHLVSYLNSANEEIVIKSLSVLMTFVKLEGSNPIGSVSKDGWHFPRELFEKIVFTMLSSEIKQLSLINEFTEFTAHDDVKYYLLRCIQKCVSEAKEITSVLCYNCFHLLSCFEYPDFDPSTNTTNTFIPQTDDKHSFKLSEKQFCKLYSNIWIQFLKYELPSEVLLKVLVELPESVIPNLQNPTLLTDFFTSAYNQGGVSCLLALNGLFSLMQRYNVEYPDFYLKLYSLFRHDLVTGVHSKRFFKLADLFLSSTHLPAYYMAAFAKRLSRIALMSSPHIIMRIISLVGNIIIRHPTLSPLIHRTEGTEYGSDPFDFDATDPAESHAMDSSLWEIKTLQNHAIPIVSRKAKLINKELPKMEFNLTAELKLTENELYLRERKRKVETAPPAIERPNKISNLLGFSLN